MKTKVFEVNGYTSGGVNYTDPLHFFEIDFPKKIEATLEVTSLEMGANDGSVLQVILQKSIDGFTWIDQVSATEGEFFKPVSVDNNDEAVNAMQVLLIADPDNRFIGNQLRFKYFMSQMGSVKSLADFKMSILIK